MSVLLEKSRLLFVKEQVDDVTPVAGDPAAADGKFLTYNLKLDAPPEVFERSPNRETHSRLNHLIGKRPITITFDLEVRRTNSGATEDEWFKLLKGCGLSVTPGASDVVVQPVTATASHTYLTMWVNRNGVLVKGVGMQGNVRFRGQSGEPMFASFEFRGVFAGATDVALPTIAHEAGIPSIFQGINLSYHPSGGSANTSLRFNQVEVDLGNEVVLRPDANTTEGYVSAVIVDRDPGGSFDPELPLVATEDFYGQLTNATEIALDFTLPSIAFSLPAIQLANVGDDQREKIDVSPLSFKAREDAAPDDELVITFT